MKATLCYMETEEMTETDHTQVREKEANVYASHEDFRAIFNEDLKELYQLSFQLTRDPEKAERLVFGADLQTRFASAPAAICHDDHLACR